MRQVEETILCDLCKLKVELGELGVSGANGENSDEPTALRFYRNGRVVELEPRGIRDAHATCLARRLVIEHDAIEREKDRAQ